jgi:hypothetical protein
MDTTILVSPKPYTRGSCLAYDFFTMLVGAIELPYSITRTALRPLRKISSTVSRSSSRHGAASFRVPLSAFCKHANNTSGNVKKFCKNNGGAFFTGAKGGGYGCLLDDGSCIVCGGVTEQQKSTCETSRGEPQSYSSDRSDFGGIN